MIQSDTFDNGHTVILGAPGHGQGGREIKPGELIGGSYEIQTLLGKGGMGYVFCAEHTIIKRQYALKMLAPELLNVSSRRRFEVEGRAIANLDHPNIVKVYNMGMDAQNCPFYVMDLLDGMALSDYIVQTNGLSLNECLDIFGQIAAGLGYAHSKGIVHRDIKPSNIVLLDDGKGRKIVKIVDFGIAKVLPGANLHSQSQTATGLVCGSPWYMSPEQCMGKNVDQRSDIYSLGCTFFEAICGLPPYRGQSAVETLIMHQEAPIPSIRHALAAKNLPSSVDLLLGKMIAKTPESRYQSMAQLIHDLDRMKQGKAIGAAVSAAGEAGYQTHKELFPVKEQFGDDKEGAEEDNNRASSAIPVGAFISFALAAVVLGCGAIWYFNRDNSGAMQFLSSWQKPATSNSAKAHVASSLEMDDRPQGDGGDLIDKPLSSEQLNIAPDPDLSTAQAAFDIAGPIKATSVQMSGRQLRRIDFPRWPIGLISAGNGALKAAAGSIFVPVKSELSLIVGGKTLSRLVLDCPKIFDKISPDLFSSLYINAADDHSNLSAMMGPASKTDAVTHMVNAASKWPNLKKLSLRNVSFTSELLNGIERCSNLDELNLYRVIVNQDALAKEPFLTRLKAFQITYAVGGVKPLCKALENSDKIVSLAFLEAHLSTDDMARLLHCPNLHKLVIRDVAINDFIPLIKQKTSLEEVWLCGRTLSPEEVSTLTRCSNIHKLVLNSGDYDESSTARLRGGEPKVSFNQDF